ncbi:MAG: hypothetical protein JWP35_2775 [Caulobacter sp.]|nr:hypothetical protein [Caulobacter sp.]
MTRPHPLKAAVRALVVAAALALGAPGLSAPALAAASVAPHDNDDFSRLVAQAEADDPATDFRALRFAWLTSAAKKRGGDTLALTQKLAGAVRARKDAEVAAIARQIIAIDYTDMRAHKYLRQACAILKDQVCADHEHFVEFGLLKSIVGVGRDGRSLATAWEVISIPEEYFIVEMAGLRSSQQALVFDNDKPYDVLTVTTEDGKTMSVYFDIAAFFGHELE